MREGLVPSHCHTISHILIHKKPSRTFAKTGSGQARDALTTGEVSAVGGGWNLVYESVGETPFLMSTDEVDVDRLFEPDFGYVERDKYFRVDTREREGAWSAFRKPAQGGKLGDESIRNLCDGQYMIHQQGQAATFCRFENVTRYGDDAESTKACSFKYDDNSQKYSTLPPEPGSR